MTPAFYAGMWAGVWVGAALTTTALVVWRALELAASDRAATVCETHEEGPRE